MNDEVVTFMRNKHYTYSSTIQTLSYQTEGKQKNDIANQANHGKDKRSEICTCKRHKKIQIDYKLHKCSNRCSFSDFDVHKIKVLPKKKVKRVYLPARIDTASGSTELSSLISNRRTTHEYLQNKRGLCSKCIGGFIPEVTTNKDTVAISYHKSKLVGNKVRSSSSKSRTGKIAKRETNININQEYSNRNTELKRNENIDTSEIKNDNICSSDSLIEHIYNLETPSLEKRSKSSIDPIENKLEREYRKMFLIKPNHTKPSSDNFTRDITSSSFLRKRFEALRQGLSWTRDVPNEIIFNKTVSHTSLLSHKDASIASDPPSLEARSFSKTNIYSPKLSMEIPYKIKEQDNLNDNKVIKEVQNECKDTVAQDVKGMFKLWGKKFNFEDDNCKKRIAVNICENINKINPEVASFEEKKSRKNIFSFFRKKNKEKYKNTFTSNSKKVTAGRCELGEGFILKIGVPNNNEIEPIQLKPDNIINDQSSILQKSWLDNFISKPMDSQKSVHIRWGNKMYRASSSTVTELRNCEYKNTPLFCESKNEINCIENAFHKRFLRPKVNFMQDIKACMMPNTILDNENFTDNLKDKQPKHYNTRVAYNNKRVFEKSKVPGPIKIVLRANDVVRKSKQSSDYILINIPEGYFSDDCDYQKQSTDEEVNYIVEYETQKSKSVINQMKVDKQLHIGDTIDKHIKVKKIVKNEDKKEALGDIKNKSKLYREIATQGSKVYIPNRLDVIEVGILTQKNMRCTRRPILKLPNFLSEEESEHLPPQKKCELAENYLLDYYRNMSLSLDFLSSSVSEFRLHTSLGNSINSLNQKESSKSCINIYDEYVPSVISPCKTSCSKCQVITKLMETNEIKANTYYNKLFKKIPYEIAADFRTFLHKDSLEVWKSRQAYAASNKSNWATDCDTKDPCPEREKGDQCADNTDASKTILKPYARLPESKKPCKKHVVLPPDNMNQCSSKASSKKSFEGILQYKEAGCNNKCNNFVSPKCTSVIPTPVCEIPQPPCKDICDTLEKPIGFKKKSQTCNLPTPQCLSEKKSWYTQSGPMMQDKMTKPISGSNEKCNKSTENLTSNQKITTNKNTSPITRDPIEQICKPCCPSKSNVHNRFIPCKSSKVCTKRNCNVSSDILDICKCCSRKSKESKNNFSNKISTLLKKNEKQSKTENMPKSQRCSDICLSPPTNLEYPSHNNEQKNHPKLTGVSLKIKPLQRNSHSNESIIRNTGYTKNMTMDSKENIMIRLRQQTPSTEEIREGCNIKVQDEDGITLYERKDYKKANDLPRRNKEYLVRDMYRDSQVNRVSATNIVNDENCLDVKPMKKNLSVADIIEINLTLKFKETDKNTNWNNSLNYSNKKSDVRNVIGSPQEVYVFEKEDNNDENELNLNITIQNFEESINKNICINESKNILSKNNVSTGNSEVNLDQQPCSVHRTMNSMNKLDSRVESNAKYGKKNSKMSFLEYDKAVSQNIPKSKEKVSTIGNVISNQEKISLLNINEIKKVTEESDTLESIGEVLNRKFVSILKNLTRNEKKDVLKEIFKTVSNIREKNKKTKFKRIQHLLHAVLTSESSDFQDRESSTLGDENTNSYLHSTLYQDSDNVHNYSHLGSSISMKKSITSESKDHIYPTLEASDTSDSDNSHPDNDDGCLCSHIANKINIFNNGNIGCCCRKLNIDKNISCNLIKQPKFVEMETQDSSKLKSVIMTNVTTMIQEQSDFTTTKQDSYFSNHKTREIKQSNNDNIVYFANDKILLCLPDSIENNTYINTPEDILQLNEIKKAVLEVYSQKTMLNAKEHVVARLPKFISYKRSHMRTYNTIKLD